MSESIKNSKSHTFLIACLLTVFLISCSRNKHEFIDISKGWKMQTGDNPEYAEPGFDDSNWKNINVGLNWEQQGYKDYDGIAYYRLKILIPESLRNSSKNITGLRLSLGKIDDQDITCFNGIEIGHENVYNENRVYIIPFKIIKWGKENLIAVRVNDTGGGGGMSAGSYFIDAFDRLSKLVKISSDNILIKGIPLPDSVITKQVFFKMKPVVAKLPCSLSVKFSDIKTKAIVFNKTFSIKLLANADTGFIYSVKLPYSGWYRAEYSFHSEYFGDTLNANSLIVYNDEDHSVVKTVTPSVNNKVPCETGPFDLGDLKLYGYLGKRVDDNISGRLLKIDERGILECFYNRPGKQTWVGEYAGKYLHAAARAWDYSKNDQLKTQMDRIADFLILSQKDDGYLGTYLPADYWTDWDIWVHKYDLLGLLSYYSVTGYEPALLTCVKIGNLMCKSFGIQPGQLNIEESGAHVGMASCSILEPMTELYRYTGDKKYLDFCNYILEAYDHPKGPKIISDLLSIGKVNKIANGKAYEMMSNFTGIVKLYQLTGNNKLIKAMQIAWDDISANRLYITGTCSKGEFFQDDFVFPADNSVHMGEGCVTTTWIQFSQAMYNLTGEARYMDEIEKSIFNHLLAAENPQTGCVSYYTALQGVKPYRCNIDGHCCLASVPRAIAAIPELVFTRNAVNGININLFTTSTFAGNIKTSDDKEVHVKIAVNSLYPQSGSVSIIIEPEVSANFKVRLRIPSWCRNFKAQVDDKMYSGLTGEYLEIENKWAANSIIKVTFKIDVRILNGGLSYPGYIAVKYGPQVLALDQSLNKEIEDLDKVVISNTSVSLVPENELWSGNRIFAIAALYKGKAASIKLVPFAEAGQTGAEVRVWLKSK